MYTFKKRGHAVAKYQRLQSSTPCPVLPSWFGVTWYSIHTEKEEAYKPVGNAKGSSMCDVGCGRDGTLHDAAVVSLTKRHRPVGPVVK